MKIKPVSTLYFGAHLPPKQKEREQKEMKLTSEYTREEVDAMRERLHESEWEGLRDRDLKQILWDGCIGWTQMEDDTVISHYTEHYGLDLEA